VLRGWGAWGTRFKKADAQESVLKQNSRPCQFRSRRGQKVQRAHMRLLKKCRAGEQLSRGGERGAKRTQKDLLI